MAVAQFDVNDLGSNEFTDLQALALQTSHDSEQTKGKQKSDTLSDQDSEGSTESEDLDSDMNMIGRLTSKESEAFPATPWWGLL